MLLFSFPEENDVIFCWFQMPPVRLPVKAKRHLLSETILCEKHLAFPYVYKKIINVLVHENSGQIENIQHLLQGISTRLLMEVTGENVRPPELRLHLQAGLVNFNFMYNCQTETVLRVLQPFQNLAVKPQNLRQ